jgi:hypothetical protein
MLVAGGGAEITQGGAGTVVSLGGVRISRGFVGVALSPQVTVEDGGKVIAGPREVAIGAAVAGVAIGLVLVAARLRAANG